jgi:hypothetical protein
MDGGFFGESEAAIGAEVERQRTVGKQMRRREQREQ